jgi:heme exporter protein A
MPAMSSLPLAVETIGLGRRYGRRWALVNVDLRIARGSVVMLAGRNGSGKSTLLRLLATAIRPDRGTIAIDGLDSSQQRDEVRRRGALLSHHSYLYEAFTALENLQVGARHGGRAASRDELMPLLQRVGLEARADDAVATFSAGMRKRLSLARVLLQEPQLLLLDEPYGQLDPPGFVLIDRVVQEFRAKGATVLMATHQVERSASLCDSALLLEEGQLIAAGPPAEIAERSLVRFGNEGA